MNNSKFDGLVSRRKLFAAYRLVLFLTILCLGLAAATVVLSLRGGRSELEAIMQDEELRQQAVDILIERARGYYDSFPDPDVGRILYPSNQSAGRRENTVFTNRFGLREKEFDVPKPPDVMRVVLLGDSFVFGSGVNQDQRLGVFLQQMLQQRIGVSRELEVLHVGVDSWNIRAEVSYLQRNLSNFEPDLVIHILVSNDLDDSSAVRGFGVAADFTSQRPQQTFSLRATWPINGLKRGFKAPNLINHALGYESRQRLQQAAADLKRLEHHLNRRGASYLVVFSWQIQPAIAGPRLLGDLPDERVTFLPRSHREDSQFRLPDGDPHWNAAGHQRVATFLYGAILERNLLPETELEPWPAAVELFNTLDQEGREEANPKHPPQLTSLMRSLKTRVDMENLHPVMTKQIYGGVYGDGMVAPYAAILLKRDGGTRIRILGETLDRSELQGTQLEILADEIPLRTVELPRNAPLDLELPLPQEILERPTFDVRFVADNYAYGGSDLRSCVAFRLKAVEVLP